MLRSNRFRQRSQVRFPYPVLIETILRPQVDCQERKFREIQDGNLGEATEISLRLDLLMSLPPHPGERARMIHQYFAEVRVLRDGCQMDLDYLLRFALVLGLDFFFALLAVIFFNSATPAITFCHSDLICSLSFSTFKIWR